MQEFTYRTKGTCSQLIQFSLDGDIIHNVRFVGGCNGNLQAIGALVEGLPVEEVVKRVQGIKCGFKDTSCSDQLANALLEALEEVRK